jgi:hypothetical protein
VAIAPSSAWHRCSRSSGSTPSCGDRRRRGQPPPRRRRPARRSCPGDTADPSRHRHPAAYVLERTVCWSRPRSSGRIRYQAGGAKPASIRSALRGDRRARRGRGSARRRAGRYPAPGAMCGPEAVRRRQPHRLEGHAPTGDYHVGLRHDADETADVLDRLFRARQRPAPREPLVASAVRDDECTGRRGRQAPAHGSTQLVRSCSGAALAPGAASLRRSSRRIPVSASTHQWSDGDAPSFPPV